MRGEERLQSRELKRLVQDLLMAQPLFSEFLWAPLLLPLRCLFLAV